MSDCVLWEGNVHPRGYGQAGRRGYAHRLVWEEAHGPIPEGMHIHHVCGEKLCQNVEHMKAIAHSDHARLHAYEKWQPGGALREHYR